MSSPSVADPAITAGMAARASIFTCAIIACSGLTVLAGTAAMIAAGIGPSLWLRNPVAWIVTLLACAGLVRLRLPPRWTLAMLVLLLAMSLGDAGQSGVHRWIGIGPVRMNAAALVLPLALVLAGRDPARGTHPGIAAALAVMAAILAWQPDLSQLAALLAALLAWAVARRSMGALLWMVPLALATLFVCARRPDPLDAVPYVEGILALAWQVSPLLAVAGGVCLLLTALSPLLLASDAGRRPAAVALTAYFLVSGAAWLAGAFPVPLAGHGLSFVIGWGIGSAALLVGQARERMGWTAAPAQS